MIIHFTKMHSLGNDFIVIDAITQSIKLHGAYVKKIADRKLGIGCDQVIILEPPTDPLSDFYYKIYNQDGKSAEQCLNGIRCGARFALDSGLVKNSSMLADCVGGKVKLTVEKNQTVAATLNITTPKINNFLFNLLDFNLQLYSLSISNHHLICLINDSYNANQKLPSLEDEFYSHAANIINKQQQIFAKGVNIGFAKVIEANKICLRVFERGCGETLACGTNALATFITARNLNLIDASTNIKFKLGALSIQAINENFTITGPVNSIFNGKFKLI